MLIKGKLNSPPEVKVRRKLFSKGFDHILDAARMAILGHSQHLVEELLATREPPPVLDSFVEY